MPESGKFVSIDGIQTHYHDVGNGPALVLLHGSGPGVSAWENWSGIIPEFAVTHRVLAPDIIGFGHTELPEDIDLNIKVWVAHLVGFLDAMDVKKAVLVGNSFGGGLALAASLRHSDRIEALVLMGSASGEFEQSPTLASGVDYENTLENMSVALKKFPYDPAIVTDDMVEARHTLSLRQVGNKAFRKLMPKPSPDGKPATVRGVPLDQLDKIELPTLLMHGREDHVIPFDVSVRAHRHLVNSELHVFGKCGHWVQHEQKAGFISTLRSFLAKIDC